MIHFTGTHTPKCLWCVFVLSTWQHTTNAAVLDQPAHKIKANNIFLYNWWIITPVSAKIQSVE